ncbi:MAG: hypothetical protein AB7G93_21120 [Bdellovibrionales bacterium]
MIMRVSVLLLMLGLFLTACPAGRSGAPGSTANTGQRDSRPAEPLNPDGKQAAGQNSGGGWESSGGDGVACFDHKAEAEVAAGEIKIQGFLSRATRAKIKSLTVLDAWDFLADELLSPILTLTEYLDAKGFSLHSDLKRGRDAGRIFEMVLENMARYTPLVSERLRMVAKHMPLKTWKASTKVGAVDDSHSVKPLGDKCVLLQLANRKTVSESGRLPKVQIFYDKELVQRFLSPVEQALLAAHEYVYLMAKEGGHKNSDAIRKLTAFLFSWQAFNFGEGKNPFVNRVLMFRVIMGYPFGDYMRFFIDEPALDKEVKGFNQYSRYRSMISLMKKLRDFVEKCPSQGRSDCAIDAVEKNPRLWESMTNEEAFIFIGRFHIDQTLYAVNSENMVIWNEGRPGEVLRAQKEEGEKICKILRNNPATQFADVHDKAILYCREVFGLKAATIRETPVRREFSCASRSVTFRSTGESDPPRFNTLAINRETGAVTKAAIFKGPKVLQSSTVVRELNKSDLEHSFFSRDVYQLVPASDEDQDFLRKLVEAEPDLFVALQVDSPTREIQDLQEALGLFKDARSKILALTVRLKCQVTFTKIPRRVGP